MNLENNHDDLVFEPTKKISGNNQAINRSEYWEKLKGYIQKGTKELKNFSQRKTELPKYLEKQAKRKEKIELKKRPHLVNKAQKILAGIVISYIFLRNIGSAEIEKKLEDNYSSAKVRVSVSQRSNYQNHYLENFALKDDRINHKVVVTVHLKNQEANHHEQIKNVEKKDITKFNYKDKTDDLIKLLKKNNIEFYEENKIVSAYTLYSDSNKYCTDGNECQPGWSAAVNTDVIPLGRILFIEDYGFCKGQDTGPAVTGARGVDVTFVNRNKITDPISGEEIGACKTWGIPQRRIIVINPKGLTTEQIKAIKEYQLNNIEKIEDHVFANYLARFKKK